MAAGGGDVSAETPFNSLGASQIAAGADDIIYVRSWDGTNTRMDAGIILANNGQSLIGSGSALLFDPAIMQVSGISAPSDNVIVSEGTAPLIGNSGVNAVSVTADNVRITGIQANGASWDSIVVTNT